MAPKVPGGICTFWNFPPGMKSPKALQASQCNYFLQIKTSLPGGNREWLRGLRKLGKLQDSSRLLPKTTLLGWGRAGWRLVSKILSSVQSQHVGQGFLGMHFASWWGKLFNANNPNKLIGSA